MGNSFRRHTSAWRDCEKVDLWLVCADTQGTLAELTTALQVRARRLQSGNEAAQKAALVDELGAERVVATGNGANDAAMLQRAALGIAVLGGEGLATACLTAADVVVPSIESALDLLLYSRRSDGIWDYGSQHPRRHCRGARIVAWSRTWRISSARIPAGATRFSAPVTATRFRSPQVHRSWPSCRWIRPWPPCATGARSRP